MPGSIELDQRNSAGEEENWIMAAGGGGENEFSYRRARRKTCRPSHLA